MPPTGKGTNLWLDLSQGGVFTKVGCIYGLKPPGIARGTEAGESCLNDLSGVNLEDSGELTYTPLTFSMNNEPDQAGTGLDSLIDDAIHNDDSIDFGVEFPLSTSVYMMGTGKLIEIEPDEHTRQDDMKRNFQILPSARWTFSATAPPEV